MKKRLIDYIDENIKVILSIQKQEKIIQETINLISKKLLQGGKILLCGNGGSAADAQHLAAEFLVRLNPKKK
jgi:D-sedoheptulose 7-phosphate isomerase